MPLYALLASILATSALGQGVDAHGLVLEDLGSELDAPLTLPWSAGVAPGSAWVGAGVDYSDRTWVGDDGEAILDDLGTAALAGGWAPVGWLRLTGTVPLHLGSVDARGRGQGLASGDLRLGVHPVLLDTDGIDLGLVLAGSLPTGSPDALLGWAGPTADLLASGTVRAESVRLTLSAGPSLRPPTASGLAPTALIGGLGVGVTATDALVLGGEARLDRPLQPEAAEALGMALELLGTARIEVRRGLVASFGVGASPTRGAGAPGTRLVFGLAGATREPEPVPEPVVVAPPMDIQPEDALVWLPHPICQWLPVSEARSRLADLPPGTEIRLVAPGHLPTTARAGDSAVQLEQAPPTGGLVVLAEPWDAVTVDGERLPEATDGVWVLAVGVGSHQVAVEGAGRTWTDEAAVVDGYTVWLRAPSVEPVGVLFGAGSAVLRTEAKERLGPLVAHPGRWVFEVRGSFSPEGDLEANRRLAETRAQSVVDWLAEQGVPEQRVRVVHNDEPVEGYTAEEQRRVDVMPVGVDL